MIAVVGRRGCGRGVKQTRMKHEQLPTRASRSQPSGDATVADSVAESAGRSATPGALARLSKLAPIAAPLLIGVIALALDLRLLGGVNFWFDEAFSFVFANRPLSQMWPDMWGKEPDMELYYVQLYVWIKVLRGFGLPLSEFWLRLPSAVWSALAAVVVFQLGRRLGGWVMAFVAAGLFALNPLQLYYAQQARSYSLQVFLICASWYALLAAMSAQSAQSARAAQAAQSTPAAPASSPMQRGFGQLDARRWWMLFALTTTLAAYAQLDTALMLGAEVVAFALAYFLPARIGGGWREQARWSLRPFAISVAAIGALCLPLAYAIRHGGHNSWVGPATPGELGRFFLVSVSGGGWLYLVVVALVCALAVARFVAIRLAAPQAEAAGKAKGWELGLLCWLIVPIALSYAVTQSFFNAHLFLDRYLVVVVPAICLLAGLGVAALRNPALRATLALALLLVAIPQTANYYATVDTQGLHTGAPWIEQHYQAGDGIACYPGSWCTLPMTYYLEVAGGPAPQLDPSAPNLDLSTQTLAAYGQTHRRVFVIIAIFDPNPGQQAQLTTLQHWADAHWKRVAQTTSSHTDYQYKGEFLTTSFTITLYDTGGATAERGQ